MGSSAADDTLRGDIGLHELPGAGPDPHPLGLLVHVGPRLENHSRAFRPLAHGQTHHLLAIRQSPCPCKYTCRTDKFPADIEYATVVFCRYFVHAFAEVWLIPVGVGRIWEGGNCWGGRVVGSARAPGLRIWYYSCLDRGRDDSLGLRASVRTCASGGETVYGHRPPMGPYWRRRERRCWGRGYSLLRGYRGDFLPARVEARSWRAGWGRTKNAFGCPRGFLLGSRWEGGRLVAADLRCDGPSGRTVRLLPISSPVRQRVVDWRGLKPNGVECL